MATRGYNSYRGRVSTGRIVLIVVLVLVLLAAEGMCRSSSHHAATRTTTKGSAQATDTKASDPVNAAASATRSGRRPGSSRF